MERKPRLLLVIPHLGGGGAEQVTAQLARRLDPDRFEIHLALMVQDGPGAPSLPDWVQVHRLGVGRVRQATWPLLRLVWKLKPRILLSGMAHLNFLILLLKPLLPKVTRVLVRQNTTASAAAGSRLSGQLYRRLYPRADRVVCQSEAMAGDLAQHFGIARGKLVVLANPVDGSRQQTRSASAEMDARGWRPGPGPRLLSVGRLAPEKGIDLLLRSLLSLRARYPRLQLMLLGQGPEEPALRQLTGELSLDDAVTFAGYVANPADYFAAATLYVLPSRYEGMPNALLEAAAAGLPVVATPCCAGVSDLLRNAPGAWLAWDVSAEALSEAVLAALSSLLQYPDRLLHDPDRNSDSGRFSPRFQHSFLAPFEPEAAIPAYEELLRSVLDEGER